MNLEEIENLPVIYTSETRDNRFDEDELADKVLDAIKLPHEMPEKEPEKPKFRARDIFSKPQLEQIAKYVPAGKKPLKIWARYEDNIDDFLPVPEKYSFSLYLICNPESGPPNGELSLDDKCFFSDTWVKEEDAVMGSRTEGYNLSRLTLAGN